MRPLRRRLFFPTIAGSILLVLLAGGAAAQEPLTEEQYVQRVLAASLEARVAEAEAVLGRAEAVGVGLWPNPELEWQRQRTSSGARAGESQDVLIASIPLVLSGRLGLEAEAAQRGAQAAEARLARARAELRREAVRGFRRGAGEPSSAGAILEESVTELKRLAEAIAVRERAGEAAGYERLRIEVEVAAVEDALARRPPRGAAGSGGRTAPARLRGEGAAFAPGELLAPEREVPDGATLLAELEAQRADVRALTLEAQGAESARRAAARSWIPDPTVNGWRPAARCGAAGSWDRVRGGALRAAAALPAGAGRGGPGGGPPGACRGTPCLAPECGTHPAHLGARGGEGPPGAAAAASRGRARADGGAAPHRRHRLQGRERRSPRAGGR